MSFRSIPFASNIISPFLTQNSFAGLPLRILSTIIHKSTVSITAQIHSKSHDNTALNCFVSSVSRYSLCISHKASTNHFTAQSSSFSFSVSVAE